MGFHDRVDYRAFSTLYGYQSLTANKRYRSYGWYAYANQTWNFGNDIIYNGYALGGYATWLNLWNAGFQGGITLRRSQDDRFTRGGPIAEGPSSWYMSLNGGSDNRKPVYMVASRSTHATNRAGTIFRSGYDDVEAGSNST